MAPKKAIRKRALSSTAEVKGSTSDTKRLRTRTPVKKSTAAKDTEGDWQSDDSPEEKESEDSDFEGNENVEESEDDQEVEEPTSDEDDYAGIARRRSKGGSGQQRARTSTGSAKGKSVALPTRAAENGAESKTASTGYGPGVEVITKKVKARPAGNVRYTNDTIHPNTMLFLGDLAANNRRDWLKSKFKRSITDF
jgi:hypothetical protein